MINWKQSHVRVRTVPFVQIGIIVELDCETFHGFFLQFSVLELESFDRGRIRCFRCRIMRSRRRHTERLSWLTHEWYSIVAAFD